MQAHYKIKRHCIIALNKLLDRQARERVVMLHNGRVGSSVVGQLLARHPHIFWDGELLKKPRVLPLQKKRSGRFDPYARIQSRFYFNRHHYGFELKHMHIDQLGLELTACLERLEEIGFNRFILLGRRNEVRRAISGMIAKQSGRYHANVDSDYRASAITVDPARVLEFMEKRSNQFKSFENALSNRHHLNLVYEDHIQDDPLVAYRMICTFLNCTPEDDLRIGLKRINPHPLAEVVTNYDELAAAFAGTRYEKMLV